MDTVREIARLLRSEKVNERRKGRKQCEVLLIEDRTTVAIPLDNVRTDGPGAELLKGVIQFEENEIRHARDKKKILEMDVVHFVRKVVKHFVTSSQRYLQLLISAADGSKIPVLVVLMEWVLKNMRDKYHESSYREEHCCILGELLDHRASHSLARNPKLLHSIYLYLHDNMTDKASIVSTSHQRILRLLCRALYSDDLDSSEVITKVVTWICRPSLGGMFHCVSDESKAEADLAVTIADCCTVLIEHHGLNIAQLAFLHMKTPIFIVIRQLPQQQNRDSYRNAYVRFLLGFMDLSIRSSYSFSSPLSDMNFLGKHEQVGSLVTSLLDSLCRALTNDDVFKSMVVSASNIQSLRQNQMAFFDPVNDPKVRLYFDTVAVAYFLQHMHVLTNSSDDDACADPQLRSGRAGDKRQRVDDSARNRISNDAASVEDHGSTKQSNPAQNSHENANTTFLSLMFARISSFTQINTRGGSPKNLPDSGLSHPTLLRMNSFVHGVPELTKTSPTLFQSLLLILQSLVSVFPRGEFLIGLADMRSNFLTKVDRIHALHGIIRTLHGILREALPLHNVQVIGVTMNTLCSLAKLTSSLCETSYTSSVVLDGGEQQEAHAVSVLHTQDEWAAVVKLLLEDASVRKLGAACRRNTVSECYFALLGTILQENTLKSTGKWAIQQRLWSVMDVVRDPRLVESPIAVQLVGNMIHSAKQEIPAVICEVLLNEVHAKNISKQIVDESEQGFLGGAVTQSHTQSNHQKAYYFETIPLEEVRGSFQSVLYIVCWLENQLDAHTSARLPLNEVLSMCDSFDYAIQSVLFDSLRTVTTGASPNGNRRSRVTSTERLGESSNHWKDCAYMTHGTSLVQASCRTADFRSVYSALGNSSWFENFTPGDTEILGYTANLASDDEIFQFLGTNLRVSADGALETDKVARSAAPHDANDWENEVKQFDFSDIECEQDDAEYLNRLEFSLKMLTPLRDALNKADIIRAQCAEAGDGLAPWQTVSLLLSSVYASLAIDAEKKKPGRSEHCQDMIKKLLLYASASFWALCDVQIAVLRFRIGHLKWTTTCEYLHNLAAIVRRVASLHTFSTKNRSGIYSEVAGCRVTLCNELIDVLQLIRDSTMVGAVGVEMDIDDDFNDQRSSPDGRKRQRAPVSDFMDGFDDEDPTTMIPKHSQGGMFSNNGSQTEYDPFRKTSKLAFSSEKQRCFSACALVFMVASFDHDDVLSVMTILKERGSGTVSSSAQLSRFGVRLDQHSKANLLQGNKPECRLLVGSEVVLAIAKDICSVYSINAVYLFFCTLQWDIEWGPLGYYKILCIICELTSRSDFLLTSQTDETRVNILSNIVLIVCARDSSLEFYPDIYWRIRYMQLQCINNIMAIQIKFKDDKQYLTLNADQKVTIRLLFTNYLKNDPDLRVRLCAAKCLPQILSFFNAKKANNVYTGLIDTENLHLVPGLHGDNTDVGSSPIENTLYGDDDPLFVVSNAIAIARMGVSSPMLLQVALLDLFRLCCARAASYQCENVERLEEALVKGLDKKYQTAEDVALGLQGEVKLMTLDTSSGQSPCSMAILYRLVVFMSSCVGYSTPELFLLEHVRWLLYVWTVDIQWSLRSFPFQMLFPFRYHASFIQDENHEHSETRDSRQKEVYKEFLRENQGLILPILLQIKDQVRRYDEISVFANDLGYNSSDQGIASLIIDSSLSIYANIFVLLGIPGDIVGDFSLSANGTQDRDLDAPGPATIDYSSGAVKCAHVLEAFIANNCDIEQVRVKCWEHRSELVQKLFHLFTFKAAHMYEPIPHGLSGKAIVMELDRISTRSVLIKALGELCTQFAVDGHEEYHVESAVSLLLSECNICEILASLQSRLHETRCSRIQLSILSAVNVVFTHVSNIFDPENFGGFRAVLSLITLISRKAMTPSVLQETSRNLCQLIEAFVKLPQRSSYTLHFERILLDLFATVLTFLHALQYYRYSAQYSADDANDTHGGSQDAANIDDAADMWLVEKDAFVSDDFSLAQYAELTKLVLASEKSAEEWRLAINCSIRDFCKIVDILVEKHHGNDIDSESRVSLSLIAPLPENFVDSLSTFRARDKTAAKLLSLSADSSYYLTSTPTVIHIRSRSCFSNKTPVEMKVHSFVDEAASSFRGDPVPLATLWLRLLNLSENLGTLAILHQSATGSESNNATLDGFNEKSVWLGDTDLIGSLVSCLLRLCKFPLAPSAAFQNKIMSILGHIGTPDLLSLSHTSLPRRLGDSLVESEYKVHAIKTRIFYRVCGLLWENSQSYHAASRVLRIWGRTKCLTDVNMESLAPKIGPSCKQYLESYANSSSSESELYSESPAGDIWEESLWSTSGKTYASWVSILASHVLKHLYGTGGLMNTPDSSRNKRTSSGKTKKVSVSKGSDPKHLSHVALFLCPLSEICLLRSDMAEAILPLALLDIVTCMPHLSVNVANVLKKHMLASSCAFSEATRLGCSTLMLFLRQNVHEFKKTTRLSLLQPRAKGGDTRSPKGAKDNRKVLFPCSLDIDLILASKAAVRCGCVCSALIFAELSREADDTPAGNILSAKEVVTSFNATSAPQSKDDEFTPELVSLLAKIFRFIHDPDALLGMLTKGNVLDMQALVYAHTGNWVAALSTYESIIQAKPTTSALPQLGIAHSLRGLGARHLLDAYASDRSACAEGNSTAPEILGLASESNWRNRSTPRVDRNFSDSSFYGEVIEPDSRLRSSAMRAEQALRSWSNADAAATATGNQSRSTEAFTSYFNSSIACALQDISRCDYGTAIQRARQCTDVLMPRILEIHSCESAFELMPSLVRVQQLFEIQEVSRMLIQNAHRDASKRTANLIKRWSVRLSSSSVTSSVSNESILSLRLMLTSLLLEKGSARPGQVLGLMDQLHQCIPRVNSRSTQAIAHSLSPLAYQIQATLQAHTLQATRSGASLKTRLSESSISSMLKSGKGSTSNEALETMALEASSPINLELREWQSEWELQEARLLWKKGLERVAVQKLDASIRCSIREYEVDKLEKIAAKGMRDPSSDNPSSQASNSVPELSNIVSRSLRQGGEWFTQTRAATGGEISEKYLTPALSYAIGVDEVIRSQSSLAMFHDKMHLAAKARVESEEHRYLDNMNRSRIAEYEACCSIYDKLTKPEKMKDENQNLRRHRDVLRKEIDADTKELRFAKECVHTYLLDALNGYAKVLELSEENNLNIVFRVINLWLNNRHDPGVNQVMSEIIENTLTYKFIPLSYQILSLVGSADVDAFEAQTNSSSSVRSSDVTSRSTSTKSTRTVHFSTNVGVLVSKMAASHPYHVLPLLFSLVNGDDYGPGSDKRVQVMTSRIRVAESILGELQSGQKRVHGPPATILEISKMKLVSNLAISLEKVLRAYISLANTSAAPWIKAQRTSGIKFSEFQGRGNRFDRCLENLKVRPGVLTLTPTIQKDGDYSQAPVVNIFKIVDEFSITDSGLSRPKIIKIIGSDGIEYKELAKSNDDMRQDAVMEQVFENVNTTLAQDEETRKRCLSMRTYKCVPMTPQSGVIQWVENARPFGDFLVNRETGAHARYYPEDWTHNECREYLKEAKEMDRYEKEKRLLHIYSKFHPAFRFFFIERYADPAQWLSCRLAYTRSVAVTSMIGYILGIGDRHSQNVMIDVSTAEVVHIDFGIVFDQGKALATPETVPFRLTRDVVDGMGITGVEGTFRKSCEEVMRTLRTNRDQILTIVEVVIRDPLYKWSLSPVEARKKQAKPQDLPANVVDIEGTADTLASDDASEFRPSIARDVAKRTLMRIRDKLHGYQDATGEGLGVEGQVEQLIATAQDPKNLSRLYYGWGPWL